MRVAIVADTFPPLRTSGAVQLRDLSSEFVRQGHQVSVLVSSPELQDSFSIEHWQGVEVVRLRTLKTKDVGYVRRTLSELLMPFMMIWNLRKTHLWNCQWGGIVFFSPSIFFGPIVHILKRRSRCPSYLIVRDIFPEWAADMGLMGRGLPYKFFKLIAAYQNSVADVIGIQTQGNEVYFTDWIAKPFRRLEVLHNWLSNGGESISSIRPEATALSGRKLFVYAGNMGIAQGMRVVLDLVAALQYRRDIGFLFVGRGSDADKLRLEAESRGMDNVLFFDEIDPDEIPSLYSQCHAGLVSLDERHRTHNIPGKFLSYMTAGLPVLAIVNEGNDLVDLIKKHQVGRACTQREIDLIKQSAEEIIDELVGKKDVHLRCEHLANGMFSTRNAVNQIVAALSAVKA